MNEIKTVNAEAFRDTVFFSLRIERFGNRAKVKDKQKLAEYLALSANGGGAVIASNATDKTSTSVKLVESERLDALNTFLNETKASLCGPFGKANPSKIKDGLFCVKSSRTSSTRR